MTITLDESRERMLQCIREQEERCVTCRERTCKSCLYRGMRESAERIYKLVRANRFRGSGEWKAMREQIIARDESYDLFEAYFHNRVVRLNSPIVHHIYGVSECWERRLDQSNLITVGIHTHNLIEDMYKTSIKYGLQEKLTDAVQTGVNIVYLLIESGAAIYED